MKIYDISIRNFRGIKILTKLKVGEINSCVGKNDSGKSNILKALDAFFNDKFTVNDVYKGIQDDENIEITIRFDTISPINSLALDKNGKLNLTKRFAFNKAGKVVKSLFYTCNDINSVDYENCWAIKESDINDFLTSLKVEFSKSGRGVTNLSKIELIDSNTKSLGRIEKSHPADDFLKILNKQYDFIELPEYSLFDAEQDLNVGAANFQSQFKPIATQSLDNNKALTTQIENNVQSDLETEFGVITDLMKRNVPNLEKIKPSLVCNWGNLVKFDLALKFEADSFEIPISNKGTGFKRLLMVAYFEYLAQKTDKKYQIFGIEEPETFLHPELQNDLLESIITLSENSQFFITTHSPIFAGATKDSNIVVVKKVKETSEYFNYENEGDILNMVIQELGIRPNYNLLNDNYRKAIFVEGSGDVLFWKTAITKFIGDFPKDILFIPCGGDQVDFFVNAELCKKINRRFIFILDSDKGAIDYQTKINNKTELKNKVEELGGNFEILRKREIENYYHKSAIQRILDNHYTLSSSFEIEDFVDIKKSIEDEIPNNVRSTLKFKSKNNLAIFEEMTTEEWRESSVTIDQTTDVESIISKIME